MCEADMVNAIQVQEKHAREDAIKEVKNQVLAKYEEQEASEAVVKQIKQILDKIVKGEVRRLITVEKIRPDGRKIDEIRPLIFPGRLIATYTWFRFVYTWTNSGTKHLYTWCNGRCPNS